MTYAIHTRWGTLIAGGFDTLSEAVTSAKHYEQAAAVVRIREERVVIYDTHTGLWRKAAVNER